MAQAISSTAAAHRELQQELRDSTDRKLFRLMRNGDNEAFRELFVRYETRLVAYAEKYLDSVDLAKDVCQEVFLKLIQKPPRILLSDSLAPWLFRVTRNLAIDKTRSRKFEICHDSVGVNEMTEERDPLQHACAASEKELLWKLVESLPEPLREVVHLRGKGGVPFREVAEILDIPQGTALWRMHRAVQILRAEWKKHVQEV